MLSADKEILQFVDNYHLHLIAPAEISDDDFSKFHTELSLVLKYIKYSKDKKKLQKMVKEETAFKSISKKTADIVNIVTNSNLYYNKGEEHINMCEAIEGIRADARAEGIEKGRAEGIEKGRAEGIEKGRAEGIEKGRAEGIEKGRAEGILKTLSSLVNDGIITISDAAKRANMPVSEFKIKTGFNS